MPANSDRKSRQDAAAIIGRLRKSLQHFTPLYERPNPQNYKGYKFRKSTILRHLAYKVLTRILQHLTDGRDGKPTTSGIDRYAKHRRRLAKHQKRQLLVPKSQTD